MMKLQNIIYHIKRECAEIVGRCTFRWNVSEPQDGQFINVIEIAHTDEDCNIQCPHRRWKIPADYHQLHNSTRTNECDHRVVQIQLLKIFRLHHAE